MKTCKVNSGRGVIRSDGDGGRLLFEAGQTFETDEADAADLVENGTVTIVTAPTPVHDAVVKAATPNAGPMGPKPAGGKPK